jgi:ubiquinone/menaquinone biosynthesis C-methylase UbiE
VRFGIRTGQVAISNFAIVPKAMTLESCATSCERGAVMAFEALKEKQSSAWSSAPYEQVSVQHVSVLDELLDRLDLQPGLRLLDVATGTGELARPAARRGLHVTGIDFAPSLIATARTLTDHEQLAVAYDVGDAEALPYPDASFDLVTSTFGVMFAPDHRAAARELARVTAPGGQLGLTAWTPDGGVGRMFAVLVPYMAAPPEGAGSPFEWGRREHLEELLADTFDLDVSEHVVPQIGASGEAMWDLMSTAYGPTKALASSLDVDRRESLHREFAAFFEGYRENGHVCLPRTYLQVIGRRHS